MKSIASIFLIAISAGALGQYLENPSFEGPVGIGLCPPQWSPVEAWSTPDTGPQDCDNFPASDGNTYLCLVARGSESNNSNTSELVSAELLSPLRSDFCYSISVDLASRQDLGHFEWERGFIPYTAPSRLNIYGSNSETEKGSMIASIEVSAGGEWKSFSISLEPDENIDHIFLEADLISSGNRNGNILIDNLQISMESQSEVVFNDTVYINQLPFTLEASEGIRYSWVPTNGLSCYDCRNPSVSSSISTTYHCKILLEEGQCPAEEVFIIWIEQIELPGTFKIPNVFTPNGDGYNDAFVIPELPAFSILRIYTRSGKEVYTADPYQNNWFGRDNSGQSLPEDTYWYVLITPGLDGTFKGKVYLKRK